MSVLDETVQTFRRFVSLRDGIDGEFRPREHVTAREDVRLRGLISKSVRDRTVAASELDCASVKQIAPLDGLPYREITRSAGTVTVSVSSYKGENLPFSSKTRVHF